MGRHLKEEALLGHRIEVKRGVASKALSTLASIAAAETEKKVNFEIPVPGRVDTIDQNSLQRGLS